MKTIIKVMAAASLFLAVVGCKSTPKYNLTDGEWVMTAWYDNNGEERMVTQNRPTMKFEEATVTGNAGCNQFMGRYEAKEKDAIKIDMGGMTLKMCMDMEVENRMVTEMPNVTSYKIDGNHLSLYNAQNKELFRFGNTVKKEE